MKSTKSEHEVSVVDATSEGYRVVVESKPTSTKHLHDNDNASCIVRRVVGTYVTKADAIQAAKRERSLHQVFDGWAEEYYGTKAPPYSTEQCEDSKRMAKEEEDYCIFIEDAVSINKSKKDIPKRKMQPSPTAPRSNKKFKTEATASKTNKRKTTMPLTYPIGTKLSKSFDGVFYNGEVVSYDPESEFYKIEYEDGDEEEMDHEDVKRCVENKMTYPIGTKISKKFQGVFYSGNVTSYNAATTYYKITYEDGDQEDMEDKQIKRYLVSSQPPKPPKIRNFGAVKLSMKAMKDNIDKNRFARNPCRIIGGEQNPAEDYANTGRGEPLKSYYYLIQRLSDRNYAMRGLCIDGDGVRYSSYRRADLTFPAVVFLPETNLNNHANDPTIVDACHLDMIHPKTGGSLITGPNLLEAVTPETECIFLNGFQNGGPSKRDKQSVDPNFIVKSIEVCKDSLKCFSLTECIVSNEILNALASCKNLRGLTLYSTQSCDASPTTTVANDRGFHAIIKACTDLRWLLVVDCNFFQGASWKALDSPTACPKLEVLWVSQPKDAKAFLNESSDAQDIIPKALAGRASILKICMIYFDTDLKSRYTPSDTAKTTDQSEGDTESS